VRVGLSHHFAVAVCGVHVLLFLDDEDEFGIAECNDKCEYGEKGHCGDLVDAIRWFLMSNPMELSARHIAPTRSSMPESIETIVPQWPKLSLEERLKLIDRLWDSVAVDLARDPVPDWIIKELDARKARYERDPSTAVTWEEAKELLRQENA
jgi:putative addiction module component (TIGR02574 family)